MKEDSLDARPSDRAKSDIYGLRLEVTLYLWDTPLDRVTGR